MFFISCVIIYFSFQLIFDDLKLSLTQIICLNSEERKLHLVKLVKDRTFVLDFIRRYAPNGDGGVNPYPPY